jgi:NADPH2:quinone reductase
LLDAIVGEVRKGRHCAAAGFVRMLCVRLPVDGAYCGLDVDIGLTLNTVGVDRRSGQRNGVIGVRAVMVTRFGGPEVLSVAQVLDPRAGPSEVVVTVSVADVLFLDTQLRRGWGQEYFAVRPPYIPGGGVAGTVTQLGPGVDHGWRGRRVVAPTPGGGYAEQAVAAGDSLVLVPDGLEMAEAAALLHDATTAFALLESTGVGPGEWVLVLAASGGLGILLVQLVRAAGARVIGATRGAAKLELVRSCGAERVIDYSLPGWEEKVRAVTGGRGPEVVFDGVGGQLGQQAFEIIANGGRFSAHGAPSGSFTPVDPEQARRRGITVRGIEQAQPNAQNRGRLIQRALREAVAGRIKPIIGQTFPLEKAAEAHAAIEARTVVGKTLLVV